MTTLGANRLIVNVLSTATDTLNDEVPGGTDIPQADGWTNANLTSLAECVDYSDIPSNGGGVHVATGVLASAGSSGNTTLTLATASGFGALTIALKGA